MLIRVRVGGFDRVKKEERKIKCVWKTDRERWQRTLPRERESKRDR